MEKLTGNQKAYPKVAFSLILGVVIGSLPPYLAFSFKDYLGLALLILIAVIASSYIFIGKLGKNINLEESHYLFIIGIYFGIIMLLPYVAIIRV